MTSDIDFDVPATVFLRQPAGMPSGSAYAPQDFDTTAEAIKHAVEAFGADSDFYISAATQRIDSDAARRAYADPGFPLERAD